MELPAQLVQQDCKYIQYFEKIFICLAIMMRQLVKLALKMMFDLAHAQHATRAKILNVIPAILLEDSLSFWLNVNRAL